MRILKPTGHYVEHMPLGSSKAVKHWQWKSKRLEAGQTISFKGVTLDIKDVTPQGLIIEYRKSPDEDR